MLCFWKCYYFAAKTNCLQSLIFIVYFFLFAWLITIIPFFKNSGIGKFGLILLFVIKIVAGFAYAWLYASPQYIATADTWHFYNDSLKETDWLLRDPIGFIKDLFYSPYNQTSNLFLSGSSYWNDLKDNVFIKLMAVINVFTNKSYYTNIIVFNFLFFFGPVALYRLVQPLWNYNKWWLIAFTFLMPSFLFWCSGVHKDGLLFSALMISVYCFHQQIIQHRFLWKHSLLMLFCFAVLFALRNVVLVLLLPALTAFYVSNTKPHYQWFVFTCFYAVGFLLFFVLPHLSPALNFPQYIINKQTEFNALPGNSKIVLPALQPTLFSLTRFFPYALDLIFLRPHWSDVKGILYLFSFLENTFVMVVMLVWVCFHQSLKKINSLLICFLFFSISVWLLCGYTVTFSGATARYKSLTTPLFIAFLFLTIDFKTFTFQKLKK